MPAPTSPKSNTIYKQIAEVLQCDYSHVKNVLATNSKLNRKTRLNKKIVTLYIQKQEEELKQLRASIIDQATNDYIIQ